MPARDGWLLFAGALVLRLAAFRPELPPTPPETLLTGADPGPALLALRGVSLLAAALAVVLVARAGSLLAGRATGWVAGALLALAPFALRHAGWIGPPGLLLLAASGLLAGLAGGRRGSGPAGLALGIAWILLGGLGLAWAPLTNAAPPGVSSPLLEGLRQIARAGGVLTAALALAGVAVALRSPRPEPRRVAALTGLLLLLVLLREGADPLSLGAVLPGATLLAALTVTRTAALLPGIPARVGWVAFALALLLAASGAVRAIAAGRAAAPSERAAEWMAQHVPAGTPVLVDDPLLPVRPFDAVARTGFNAVRIPPGDAVPAERPLYYDPELAGMFPWIVIREASGGASPGRARFQEFFRKEWETAARFGQGEYPDAPITVLERPVEWSADRRELAALGEEIRASVPFALRDSSRVFTAWLLQAGEALRAAGHLAGAQGLLLRASSRGGSAEVWFEIGLTNLLEERWNEAMSAFLDALSLDPRHGGAHYNLATLLEREGDLDGAETEYRAATVYLDTPAPAHARLGILLARRGRVEDAEAELQELRRLEPDGEAVAYLESAIAEARGGRP